MKLVIQSERDPLESSLGYVLRLCELNGFDRPPFRFSRFHDPQNFSSAEASAYEALPTSMKVQGRARICPDCLDEMMFARFLWNIKPYIACHVHQRLLVDGCPACGKPLSWRRPGLLQCLCGASLRQGPRVYATPLQVMVASMLNERLMGQVPGSEPAISGSDVETIATLSWFFGTDPNLSNWRSAYLAKPSVLESGAIVERGGRTLSRWPSSFDGWLETRLKEGGEIELYFWLRRLRSALGESAFSLMEQAGRFLDQRDDVTPLRRDAFFATRRSWIVAGDVARQLRVTNATVAGWVDGGELEARIVRRAQRSTRLISRQSLSVLRARLALEIGVQEAMERLNISRGQLRGLRHAGLVDARRRGTWWRYNATSIEHLQWRLNAVAKPHPSDETISITDCGRGWRLPIENLALEALAGQRPIYHDGSCGGGMRAFVIARPVQRNPGGASVPFNRAAADLRVAQRMIAILVKAGCLIQTIDAGRPAITCASLADCKTEFVTSAVIANALGTNTRSVISYLKAQGVKPAILGNSSRGISSVWRRCPIVTGLLAQASEFQSENHKIFTPKK